MGCYCHCNFDGLSKIPFDHFEIVFVYYMGLKWRFITVHDVKPNRFVYRKKNIKSTRTKYHLKLLISNVNSLTCSSNTWHGHFECFADDEKWSRSNGDQVMLTGYQLPIKICMRNQITLICKFDDEFKPVRRGGISFDDFLSNCIKSCG